MKHTKLALGTLVVTLGLLMASPAAWAVLVKAADWQMNDTSGQMIDSSANNNNNGTPTDVVRTGSTYRFNGSTSRVAVPDDDSLDPAAKDIKLAARLRVNGASLDDDSYDVVRKGLSTTSGGDYKMEIKRTSTNPAVGKLHCVFKGSGGSVSKVARPDIVDGNWHTLECAKTSTSVVARVDGRSYTKAGSAGTISNPKEVLIGAKQTNPLDDVFEGSMDFVSIDIAASVGPQEVTTEQTTPEATSGEETVVPQQVTALPGPGPIPAPTDESALCQNPQRVIQDDSETGDSRNSFTTTTDVFRVNYVGRGFDVAPNSTARIRIQTISGQRVAIETINANESISFAVNAPPGTYEILIDIDPNSAESRTTYAWSVDQCRETIPAPTDGSALCQNPQRLIQDDSETGDSRNSFTTTTDVFRVNYVGRGFDVAPNSTARIRIQTISGQRVAIETINANESISFAVNAPPGTYEILIDIDPNSAESRTTYAWSVDQCRETIPAPTDGSALCQNPQRLIQDDSETGDSRNSFTTTTDVFRVNYVGRGFDVAPNSTARIRIQTISGQEVATQIINAGESISFAVNAPPGTYEILIDIDPNSAESRTTYAWSVDQCRETTPGTTDNTVIVDDTLATALATGGTAGTSVIVANPGTTDAPRETIIIPRDSTLVKDGVIRETIPRDKVLLPNTGGLSFFGLAVALLTLLIVGTTKVLSSVVRR